ncbi:MAG: shikimate dehydrogenase, partial [Rubricoccaceae bacterium]
MTPPRPPGAETALLALLGDPVAHSLSPALHGAALRADGLDAVYLAFRVAPAALADALTGLWALGAWGANVTLPHKQAACALAAERSAAAAATGAANALVRTASGWRAENTDVEGFLAPLAPHRAAI